MIVVSDHALQRGKERILETGKRITIGKLRRFAEKAFIFGMEIDDFNSEKGKKYFERYKGKNQIVKVYGSFVFIFSMTDNFPKSIVKEEKRIKKKMKYDEKEGGAL
jgi:hypothetical protein